MRTDWSGGDAAEFTGAEVPPTPAMRLCLERAYRSSVLRLGLAAGVPLALAGAAIVAGSFLFVALALVVVVGLNTPKAALRAYRLRRAQADPAIVRVRGPVAVTRHRRNGSESYGLFYKAWVRRSAARDDWRGFDIDESGFDDVAQFATPVPDFRPGLLKLFSAIRRNEVADAISTYSRTGHLLLDVRRPDGVAIYCHRAYDGECWST